MRCAPTILIVAALATVVSATRYTLHHRIGTSTSWTPRAVITLDQQGGSPIYEDATGRPQPWEGLAASTLDSSQIYQLALTPESQKTVDLASPMTFVKACLLASASDESITIHQSGQDSSNGAHRLSYDLLGIDASTLASSGCPLEYSAQSQIPKLNVQVRMPEAPLVPLAPSPPPIKADGTPLAEGEEAPKEKSFLAKNWYYFVPILLLMAIPTEFADSAAEESEEGGAENPFQAGAQRPAGNGAVKVGGGARRR